jgi:hypothetical protein
MVGKLMRIQRRMVCRYLSAALKFLQAPSDLVPGVYEGGLKT